MILIQRIPCWRSLLSRALPVPTKCCSEDCKFFIDSISPVSHSTLLQVVKMAMTPILDWVLCLAMAGSAFGWLYARIDSYCGKHFIAHPSKMDECILKRQAGVRCTGFQFLQNKDELDDWFILNSCCGGNWERPVNGILRLSKRRMPSYWAQRSCFEKAVPEIFDWAIF